MPSRYDIPLDLLATESHGWFFMLVMFAIVWGTIRLFSTGTLNQQLLHYSVPINHYDYDNYDRIGIVIWSLYLFGSALLAFGIDHFATDLTILKSSIIPNYLVWWIAILLGLTIWYLLFYFVFLVIDEPYLGITLITSSITINSILPIIALPIIVFHTYQDSLLSDEALEQILFFLLVGVVIFRTLIRIRFVWLRTSLPWVHRILYLCALEILPILVVFAAYFRQ